MEQVNKLPLNIIMNCIQLFKRVSRLSIATQRNKPDLLHASHAFRNDSKWGDTT